MAEQNTDLLPHDHRIEFRSGIHVWLHHHRRKTIFSATAVNIAVPARRDAEAGGCIISDDAYVKSLVKVVSRLTI